MDQMLGLLDLLSQDTWDSQKFGSPLLFSAKDGLDEIPVVVFTSRLQKQSSRVLEMLLK